MEPNRAMAPFPASRDIAAAAWGLRLGLPWRSAAGQPNREHQNQKHPKASRASPSSTAASSRALFRRMAATSCSVIGDPSFFPQYTRMRRGRCEKTVTDF